MNSENPCHGCTLLMHDESTLLQTTFWKVDLSDNQAYLGRAYVTLKRHAGHLSSLTTDEWADLGEAIRKVEETTSKAFNATSFNWTALMNAAYKNEIPNPHVHLHMWPRYKSPSTVLGVEFEDPNFGHHYDKKVVRNIRPEILAAIKARFIEQAS